jgi:N-acetylglucosamine kinase-like BadF-type ATPase
LWCVCATNISEILCFQGLHLKCSHPSQIIEGLDGLLEKIVLGIDGGGTSTKAVLANTQGAVLGYGKAGPSCPDDVSIDSTRKNIKSAVDQAWSAYGQEPRPADAAFLGIAGVVTEADCAVIDEIATSVNLADADFIGYDHDVRIALAGSLALQPGIVLIAGTGSSCYGSNASGFSCRVGGWGYLLDDVGSSYYLGVEAMRAIVRSADGRLGHTALSGPLMDVLGIDDIQQIIQRLYTPRMRKIEIAGLAPLVLEIAQQGDAIAQQIVRDGHDGLAYLIEIAAKRLAFQPDQVLVSVSGGLAHSGDYYKQGLYQSIRTRVPGAQIQEPALSPVLGAALLAIQYLGIEPSASVISKFQQSELQSK